jgi:hypothetical protein
MLGPMKQTSGDTPESGGLMSSEDRQRMMALCERIQTEKSPAEFTKLIYELNVLLEKRHVDIKSDDGAYEPENLGKVR